MEIEAGGRGRSLMARQAMRFQKALGVAEGIACGLRGESNRECQQRRGATFEAAYSHRSELFNEFIIIDCRET